MSLSRSVFADSSSPVTYRTSDYALSAGETLFPHPVDWRLSAVQNASSLLAHIHAVLQATGADKVNIIAHSQGGLVSIAALSRSASVGKVNRLVTLGTPFLGAAKALGVLKYQKPCMIPAGPYCLVNKAKLQELGTNMPGMLDLLPSQLYFAQVDVPLVTRRPFRDETVARDVRELFQLLTFDSEPMVDYDGVTFYRSSDDEHSEAHDEFVNWLDTHFGLAATDDPDRVVGAAQAEYGERFATWKSAYLD